MEPVIFWLYILPIFIGFLALIGLIFQNHVIKTWGQAIVAFISLLIPMVNVIVTPLLVWMVLGPIMGEAIPEEHI